MIDNKKVYAVIPARGGSSRLHRKNIHPIWGKPMLYWAVQACRHSAHIDRWFVSTEDAEIAAIARQCGAELIERPSELADHITYKQEVIVHAMEVISDPPDLVVSLQPNSPEVCFHDLDAAIAKLVRYDRNEIFSVDETLLMNAAFRVLKYDYVFQKTISTRSGVYLARYRDVHTPQDVAYLEAYSRPCTHLALPKE